MPDDSTPVDRTYEERGERFAQAAERCTRRSRWAAHARLLVFIAIALPLLLLPGAGPGRLPLLIGLAVVSFVAFLALIAFHNEIDRRCSWYAELVKINAEGRSRLTRDWGKLTTRDELFADPDCRFADDLDIFGQASLFSLLGTAATPLGRELLRRWLLNPADRATVLERQAAVAELAPAIDLREAITAHGRLMTLSGTAFLEGFLDWAAGDPWLRLRPHLLWAARLLPVATLSLIVLNIVGVVPYLAWLAALAFNLGFTFKAGAEVHRIFDRAFARENAFQRYARLSALLTDSSFSTPRLERIRSEMSKGNLVAHRQMKRLHRLLSLAEVRYAMTYLPFQAFTLWDFHVLSLLERWQLNAGRHARRWLDALAELDALAALAALRFENPDWTFPHISDEETPALEATGLGHPLLPDDVRVVNDVKLGPPGSFLFITGSNMSGKSTLLRAIGTNAVLARAGAPVCASSMRLPPLILETSMRVHDSLQQGLSHFMAELRRLKEIVDVARKTRDEGNGALLYLLDDILRGTNTAERRIAARKVIGHLLAEGALGAVTSHDLALADTEELAQACHAVHFSEQIHEGPEGPRISFDYKLRPGIATSRNALKLLEIVGLDSGHAADSDRSLAKGEPAEESK
ncbi:MAG: DNA mismatch repair protein MutS [Gemmatimonadota bacterium]|nr:MAG: DNA mismatch repair protein MutS [Gemmatimonadota bacterium]